MSKVIGRKVKVVAGVRSATGYNGLVGVVYEVSGYPVYPVQVVFDADKYPFSPEELRYLNNRPVVL